MAFFCASNISGYVRFHIFGGSSLLKNLTLSRLSLSQNLTAFFFFLLFLMADFNKEDDIDDEFAS